jgi:hypothetical protein
MWSNVFFNTKDTKFFTIQLEANFHFQIMTIISEKQTDLFSSWSILALFLPACDRLRFGSVFLRTTKVSFISAWFFLSECVPCQEFEAYTISVHTSKAICLLCVPSFIIIFKLEFWVCLPAESLILCCFVYIVLLMKDSQWTIRSTSYIERKNKMMTTATPSTTHND